MPYRISKNRRDSTTLAVPLIFSAAESKNVICQRTEFSIQKWVNDFSSQIVREPTLEKFPSYSTRWFYVFWANKSEKGLCHLTHPAFPGNRISPKKLSNYGFGYVIKNRTFPRYVMGWYSGILSCWFLKWINMGSSRI